jgi:AcrR family transcriptional regulator
MGAKYPNRNDRRVQRTHRTLREALIALMLEKGWEAVSVQDICERADVGRSTFYTHFADKEELLVGGFHDLREMIRAGLAEHPAHPLPDGPGGERTQRTSQAPQAPLRFARGMIDHAHENQRLFRALVGKRSGQVVVRRFRELIVTFVREDLAHLHDASAPATEAAVHFISGGFLELLTWWLETRNALQPPDIEGLFLQMATPAIEVIPRKRTT